jgi:hypothetical protein
MCAIFTDPDLIAPSISRETSVRVTVTNMEKEGIQHFFLLAHDPIPRCPGERIDQ